MSDDSQIDAAAVGSAPSAERLTMTGIRMSFSGNEVLHGVNLSLRPAEVHALVGENGAGKSTLMKILAGEIKPDEGEILVDGQPVDYRSPRGAQAVGIVMIHQELSYVPPLSVAENLFLGRLPRDRAGRVKWVQARRDAANQMSVFGLDISVKARMDELTMAERQMVEIVRAVGQEAKILIMDEPTSSLTAREVQTMFGVIQALRSQGVSIIYISHHLDEIFQVADRVTVLRDGSNVSSRAVSATTHQTLVQEMVGGELVNFRREPVITGQAPVALTVDHLVSGDGVSDLSFTVKRGEVYGLYGLVGGGQELVARIIAGVHRADAGTMQLGEDQYAPRSARQAIKAGVGFVPSDRKLEGLAPTMSVRQNLTLPSLQAVSRLGVLQARRERAVAERIKGDVRIKATGIGQPVAFLSGGNQQKVVLGRWFVRDMRFLVLADPTRGVDVGAKSDIYALIESLTSEEVGVLIVSSDLPELLAICDRIGVFRRGKLVRELEAAQTSQEQILSIAAGGTE